MEKQVQINIYILSKLDSLIESDFVVILEIFSIMLVVPSLY